MGEVAMSSEEVVNLEVEERETEAEKKKVVEQEEDGSTTTVVRWERFLPKKVLRVLLVEADDSTRQIVAALLRKCSYKVAAVPDGLKAWEVLKGKPHNIDLILTEVDLPSISGFALLTLIMEHEICKNIPVIMMSWHDAVSTVYKCMLRGAADFLVKPVRKNELRNLWQHVWRRQSSTKGENGPQDDNFAQQKVEATAENNGVSNHSSGYMACVQRNRECIEKGSDTQSSCTKPDMEAERAYTENMQALSQPKWNKSPASDMQTHTGEELGVGEYEEVTAMAQDDYIVPKSQREHPNIISETCDIDKVFVNTSREAIDLIGAFDNYTKCSYRSAGSNIGTNKVDSSLLLDLSLRRSHPSGSVNQVSDERHALNHSDASAFSRYINRALQPLHSSASICNQQKDHGTNSERRLSNHALDYNSDAHGFGPSSQENVLSLASTQCGQAEVTFSCPQQTVFPIPVRGIRFESLCTPYGSVGPPIVCTQSSPVNGFQSSRLETKNPQQCHILFDQNANNSTNQTENKERHKLDSSDDPRHFSSATDQSTTSSFYNGTASHLNSNGNVDQVVVVHTAMESGNEEGLSINDRNGYRSGQREAALNKFRLKRKDRCYEKKVRYESRKKLAEQRPRVKGQFVRHVLTEPTPVETESHCGYSLDC